MENNINMKRPIKITESFWSVYSLVNPNDLNDQGGSTFNLEASIVKQNNVYKVLDINDNEIFRLSENGDSFIRAFEQTERILGCKMFV